MQKTRQHKAMQRGILPRSSATWLWPAASSRGGLRPRPQVDVLHGGGEQGHPDVGLAERPHVVGAVPARWRVQAVEHRGGESWDTPGAGY